MVTHDPIAASYADRVLFLGDGRIVADRSQQSAEQISAHMLAAEGGALRDPEDDAPVDAEDDVVRAVRA